MNFIKENFSIKDLENLTGIKAHTIRIWEQRYNLLTPNRSDTNIRTYSGTELMKLLNVHLLNSNGEKISKIAKLSEEEINEKLAQLTKIENNYFGKQVNDLILSMLNFDLSSFNNIYDNARTKYSFHEVFISIFIPLLDKIGVLWQSNSIKSAHEYFISNLIREKVYSEIDRIKPPKLGLLDKSSLYIVFLPLNEIHDLGSLFIYFKLLERGKYVIYLGPNISENSLSVLDELDKGKTTYIIHGTTQPVSDKMSKFVENIKKILRNDDRVIFAGRKAEELSDFSGKDKRFIALTQLDNLGQLID